MRIQSGEILLVDLPFRKSFKHAAFSRASSSSVFLKLTAEDGSVGFGECLPREYVTGETQQSVYRVLEQLLPFLHGLSFTNLSELLQFLHECDGKPPGDWLTSAEPVSAAWCAIDLALLDTFSRAFSEPIPIGNNPYPANLRYAGAVSSGSGLAYKVSLAKMRLYGFNDVKLKVTAGESSAKLTAARSILGPRCSIRLDGNMALNEQDVRALVPVLLETNIAALEQPLPVSELEAAARLCSLLTTAIVADEAVSDRESLESVIASRACDVVNIRISKCGGLVSSLRRASQCFSAGLEVQVGCQVGESSLLSAANLRLISEIQRVAYAEGCYGKHLLREDPFSPLLQFGYGGRAPHIPPGLGFGVSADEECLRRYSRTTSNDRQSSDRGERYESRTS